MAKSIAPPKATGGGGFVYEAKVAAFYMSLMLSGESPFGKESGVITRIDLQTGVDGWLLDDILLTLKDANGLIHKAAISVKSNLQFSANKVPDEFVKLAWQQFLHEGTTVFDSENDLLGLVTLPLSSRLRKQLNELSQKSRKQEPSDLASRLTISRYGSGAERDLLASLSCPGDLAQKHGITSNETGKLLARLEFPEFDFDSPSSRDESQAIARCANLLANPDPKQAASLWDRLWNLSDEYRPNNGMLDRRKLISLLQGFQLKEYPFYQHDWEILIDNSRSTIESIPSTIGDICVVRAELLAELRGLVDAHKHLVVLGPSGCGKSAMVKEFAKKQLAGQTVLWWHASLFDDVPDYAAFERNLGLQHRLRDLMQNTSSSMPILVIDGIDRIYQNKAYRILAALIRILDSQSPGNPWRIIVTCQSEEWDRVRKRLLEVNLSSLLWQSFFVKDFQPDTENLSPIWDQYPSLRLLFFQDRLRPVLCKPIVLSALAMNAAELHENITKTWVGESDIIDWFWNSVVRRREPEAVRSEMLMMLGEKQADRLEHDVPERELPNLNYLSDLKQDGLCVSRPYDRITFYHDIYGDWARLRRLVQLGQGAVPLIKQRSESPMWHKAIRLYGLHLLERNDDLNQWLIAFNALESEDNAKNLGQILLLDAAILAANAPLAIESLSPVLLANDGKLLLILLRRFLHIATLPDPRMQIMAEQEGWDVHETAVEFRIPNWPLWPAMIHFLYDHKEQVVAVVAGTVSEIADKWLRETPVGYPLRREAAELGVLIAERVLHREPVVGTQVGDYRSGLAAAYELPERVAAFALEAAGRTANALENRQGTGGHRRRRSDASAEPWPDGPRTDVDTDFQEQCLSPSNASTIYPLIDANPSVAREVILALLISPSQEISSIYDYSSILLDRLEIENIHGYYPPIYFRGPFLYFLRTQPDEGLELIIRLTNFVTDRWADRSLQRGLTPVTISLDLPEKHAEWVGDYYVHQWHQTQGHAPIPVECALMALEKWLYEKAEAGESLVQVISTIHARSHSLALIGVLCALGRKKPELFSGPLLPYLATPELHNWEMTSTVQPSWSWAQIGWGMEQLEWLGKLAYEWYNAPHRKHGMDQWAIRLFLTDDQVQAFLQQAVEKWKQRLQSATDSGVAGWLEPLIPKFEVDNYRQVTDENGNTYMVYHQPVDLQKKYAPILQDIGEQSRLRNFVLKCRQILDEQLILEDTDLETLWQEFQVVSLIPDHEQLEPLFFSNRNARCAGAAVFIELHMKWLESCPEHLAWCRKQLTESVLNPPNPTDDDMEYFAGDNWVWDRFCSRAIPTLWQYQPDSTELRRCVALLATGNHKNSIASLFWSAARYRGTLGDNFRQLQHLLLRYASIYLLCNPMYTYYNPDFQWKRWRQERVDAFVAGSISPVVPAWTDVMQEEFMPSKQFEEAEKAYISLMGGDPREQKPVLDTMLINAAYSWLPELTGALDDQERAEWIDFWKQSLSYSLENHTDASLPYPADIWVLERIPGIIAEMQASENPRSVWEPILNLATNKEHWVGAFLDNWFVYGLSDTEITEGFRQQWIEMLEFGFASDRWDAQHSSSWYRTLDLWTRLMGLWVSTEGPGLWTNTKVNLVLSMQGYFERWGNMFLRYGHCAQRYASFLVQPAATPIRIRSLPWLKTGADASGDHWWKERDLEDTLARLLTVMWNDQQEELKQHQPAFAVFMSFLSKLAAQLNQIALELESRM